MNKQIFVNEWTEVLKQKQSTGITRRDLRKYAWNIFRGFRFEELQEPWKVKYVVVPTAAGEELWFDGVLLIVLVHTVSHATQSPSIEVLSDRLLIHVSVID